MTWHREHDVFFFFHIWLGYQRETQYFNNRRWTSVFFFEAHNLFRNIIAVATTRDATWWNSSLYCGAKFSYRGRDNYAKRRISCSHAPLSTSAFNELTAFNKRAVCKRSEFALRRRHVNACELNRLAESTKTTPLPPRNTLPSPLFYFLFKFAWIITSWIHMLYSMPRAHAPETTSSLKFPSCTRSNFPKAGQNFLPTRKIVITLDIFRSALINSIVTKEKKKMDSLIAKFTFIYNNTNRLVFGCISCNNNIIKSFAKFCMKYERIPWWIWKQFISLWLVSKAVD